MRKRTPPVPRDSIPILQCTGCKRMLPYTAFSPYEKAPGRGYRSYRCKDPCEKIRMAEKNAKDRETRVRDSKLENLSFGEYGQVVSQCEIAKEMGLSNKSISVIEKRALAKARAALEAMGYSVADLLEV